MHCYNTSVKRIREVHKMLRHRTVDNTTRNTVVFGTVVKEVEEHYTLREEAVAKARELRQNENIAYVFDGYWVPTHDYRVLYGYKA